MPESGRTRNGPASASFDADSQDPSRDRVARCERETSYSDPIPDDPAERVAAILERVVDTLEIDATVEVEEDEGQITGFVDGEDVGRLIGRRGQTIDAVQLICYRAAQRGIKDRKRVIVDAAGYRERRREHARATRPIVPPSGRWRPARRSSSSR